MVITQIDVLARLGQDEGHEHEHEPEVVVGRCGRTAWPLSGRWAQ